MTSPSESSDGAGALGVGCWVDWRRREKKPRLNVLGIENDGGPDEEVRRGRVAVSFRLVWECVRELEGNGMVVSRWSVGELSSGTERSR